MRKVKAHQSNALQILNLMTAGPSSAEDAAAAQALSVGHKRLCFFAGGQKSGTLLVQCRYQSPYRYQSTSFSTAFIYDIFHRHLWYIASVD